MIDRNYYLTHITGALEIFPICAILGPRQCGKTTLAHAYIKQLKEDEKSYFFDLEDPAHLDQFKNLKTTLEPLNGLIVIDEIQRQPEIFPYLRVLADYANKKFLILGSAFGELLRQCSESLAGRIEYMELTPFNLIEINDFRELWLRGGFPKSYLAKNYVQSLRWRNSYITSFIERDLPSLGISLNAHVMRQLWMMLAHNHGQLLNYSELGRSLGLTDMTIKRYTEILEQTFMIRLLKPWYENISKRQVKAPKVYIRDSGILHALLGIHEHDWYVHPKRGLSFEGFVIEELIRKFKTDAEYFFWRTQTGAELDLLIIKNGKKYGFEVQNADAPSITKSMHTVLADLQLEHLYIVTAGNNTYKKTEKISVVGIASLSNLQLG
ncbi:ATP-binding protein [Rickettsia sp. Tenjiku01]|uniref:ATP-binding protein n=1 Tax=Rickettsia sp. Tenjiku01 TaxID=1736693 RepID=UPI0007DB33B9|nr:ATP-binding protein [Rickettsia sp. Tenjiku01]